MLCEKCKKNEATFYYHENVNGTQKTYRLCEHCAEEMQKNGEISTMDSDKFFEGFDSFFGDPFSHMNSLLSGLFGEGGVKQLGEAKTEKKCPACGTTFREFAENGMAGCPKCYETFEDELKPTIGRVHGHTSHVGRAPSRFKERIDNKKKIAALEEEQKQAVKNEDYERAAQIRDELKNLRGQN